MNRAGRIVVASVVAGAACQSGGGGTDGETTGSVQATDTSGTSGTQGLDSGGTQTLESIGSVGASSESTTDTSADQSSGSTAAEASDAIDCAALPAAPVSTNIVPGARGYHGLVITPEGDMIGSDEVSLIQSNDKGEWSVFAPGTGAGEQMQWLPDGGFAFALDAGLSVVAVDATIGVLDPDVGAYGIALGPDGQIWAAAVESVFRIDPLSGAKSVVLEGLPNVSVRTIGFSPDDSRVYIGTIATDGLILSADLDGAGNPTTPLSVFVDSVGTEGKIFAPIGGPWHDTMEVDACGNLYVSDFNTWTLYRISPAGDVVPYWFPGGLLPHLHAMVWGTGEHGWRADALYATQPYNEHAVVEIVVGVPSREFTGEVTNVAR